MLIMLNNLPISSTALLLVVGAFISFYGAVRIRAKAAANPQNQLFHYFGNFFVALTIFNVIFGIPFLTMQSNEKAMVWGYVIAQFFFGLAMVSLAGLVARSLNKPAWFWQVPVFLITIVGTFVHVTQFPAYDFAAFEAYNIQKVTPTQAGAAFIGLKAILVILPLAIIMIRQAIKVPVARLRSTLIAVGLMTTFVGGPMHDVAGPELFVVADLITLLGFVIILAGLLVEPNSVSKKR